MTTISERTKLLIDSQGMNEYSFSKRIGKSNTAIAKLVKGESKPGYDMLESIFQEFPKLSRVWYLEGHGVMWEHEQEAGIKSDNYLQDHLGKLEENFASLLEQLKVKDHQLETKDSQLIAKDQHIERLTRMLETFVGKPEGATDEPLSTSLSEFNALFNFYRLSTGYGDLFSPKPTNDAGGKVGGTPFSQAENALTVS